MSQQYEHSIVETQAKQSFAIIEDKKTQLKAKREMLKDTYENDDEYRELNDEVRNAKRKLAVKKAVIDSEDAVKELKSEINALKDDLKEEQLNLSDYLSSLKSHTGIKTLTIEGQDLEIVTSSKLKKA